MLSDIKREYIVTVREHGDLGNFYDEMETSGSDGYCELWRGWLCGPFSFSSTNGRM